jgi:hypothetical protein
VPRLLLNGFSHQEKIWLYDKQARKAFRTNTINAFVEGDFNTVSGEDFKIEGEELFGRIETAVAPIIYAIRKRNDLCHLSDDEKLAIAQFAALQHLRSKQSRRFFSVFREEMQRRFPDIPQSKFDLPGLSQFEADKFTSLDLVAKLWVN